MKRFVISYTCDDGDTKSTLFYAGSELGAVRRILMFKQEQLKTDLQDTFEDQVANFIEDYGVNPLNFHAPAAIANMMSGPGLGRFTVEEVEVSTDAKPETQQPLTLEEKLLLEDQLTARIDASIPVTEELRKMWVARLKKSGVTVGRGDMSSMSAEELLDNLGVKSISVFSDDVIVSGGGPLGTWGRLPRREGMGRARSQRLPTEAR